MTTYVLAGGCFWCLDAVYRKTRGVESSLCGYTGGKAEDAEYYAVASGKTKHAESVKITFDESIIPPDIILDIFFTIHDPTSLNRQGADAGPQYRSAIFYTDEQQKHYFEGVIERISANYDKPIVTQLTKLEEFYTAEPEQQDYYAKNPFSGYCSFVITPKVFKARKAFAKFTIT